MNTRTFKEHRAMKTKIILIAMLAVCTAVAQATLVDSWNSGSLSISIPDGNVAGIAGGSAYPDLQHTVTGLSDGGISTVEVRLNISGGYNGDLFGYLTYSDGSGTATAVLLNRVGTAPFYSDGSGFSSITLSDAGASSIQTFNPGSGVSVPTATYSAYESLNSAFGGMSGNGTWTLFLADMSGDAVPNSSTLVGWGLDINVVPEPTTWALIIFAALLAAAKLPGWLRRAYAGWVARKI